MHLRNRSSMQKIPFPPLINKNLFSVESSAAEPKFGLPKDVRFCSRCVISNQRPNSAQEIQHRSTSKKATIHFDEQGVCDACRVAERKAVSIDWEEREAALEELCANHRRSDGHYDCVSLVVVGKTVSLPLTY